MTDLPAPFIERTRRLLGDDYPRFAEALESESPTSIRLNPSKSGDSRRRVIGGCVR